MVENFFLLIAIANMAFASITTFYGPRWVLAITAACSLLAWLAVFLAAGQPAGWGLLAAIPWTALLMALGWLARHPYGWQDGIEEIRYRLRSIGRGK